MGSCKRVLPNHVFTKFIFVCITVWLPKCLDSGLSLHSWEVSCAISRSVKMLSDFLFLEKFLSRPCFKGYCKIFSREIKKKKKKASRYNEKAFSLQHFQTFGIILRATLTTWLRYLLISLFSLDFFYDSCILGRHFLYLVTYMYPKTKKMYRKKNVQM